MTPGVVGSGLHGMFGRGESCGWGAWGSGLLGLGRGGWRGGLVSRDRLRRGEGTLGLWDFGIDFWRMDFV